jgi:Ca2+-binding RTX toxin-like protein
MLRPTLLVTALALLVTPGAASAVTVEKDGNEIVVTALPGENNDLQITLDGGQILVQDFANPVSPSGGICFLVNGAARCPATNVEGIQVFAGDGTNEVGAFAPFQTTIDGSTGTANTFKAPGATSAGLIGGAGPDTLTGSDGSDSISGGAGNDTIDGDDSGDDISGGADNDSLVGGGGPDQFVGGGGIDTVSYVSVGTDPVDVSLDDDNDDGRAGENDNVRADIENVIGGAGPDVIRGSGAPNTLSGGDGADTIYGDAGVDTLTGGFNDDVLWGGTSGDDLRGGRENDELNGETGADRLEGNAGADKLKGGPATDTVVYSNYSVPVTVDLDGSTFDDGAESEGDSVGADVENVIGGSGNDVLTGNASANGLDGASGDDTIDPGAGPDVVLAGLGADTVTTLDGEIDQISCGGDLDALSVDAGDLLIACPAPPTPPAPPADPQPGGPAAPGEGGTGQPGTGGNVPPSVPPTPGVRSVLTIGPSAVRLTRKREARIKLSCASATCSGTLRLTRKVKGKTVVLGRARYSIAAGKSRVVKVRVSKATVRRIGRRGLKVTATAGPSKRTINLKRGR